MVLPFVHALPRKIAEILRFLPPKNYRRLFHEICIAKVLLTSKPRSVADFRECELGGDTETGGKKSEGELIGLQ